MCNLIESGGGRSELGNEQRINSSYQTQIDRLSQADIEISGSNLELNLAYKSLEFKNLLG